MQNHPLSELARSIRLIGPTPAPSIDLHLFSSFEGDCMITADFSIVPYDSGKPIEAIDPEDPQPVMLGYEYSLPDGRTVYSYDHHGPDRRMERADVTSSTLSAKRMELYPEPIDRVYLTHTDADSILSACIFLTGKPDKKFIEASVAADHTGAENEIADVLQSIAQLRDVEFSLECLDAILRSRPLPVGAEKYLKARVNDRERAARYVQEGIIRHIGRGVYVGRFDEMLSGELLPALIPEAKVIVLVSSMENGNKEIKLRAGFRFPAGMSLENFAPPSYGGRWNAGSTKRFGGTPEDKVDSFIDLIRTRI